MVILHLLHCAGKVRAFGTGPATEVDSDKEDQINALFEVWDNDRSGYLELDELQLVLGHWKDFSSEQAQEHGEKTPVRSGYT